MPKTAVPPVPALREPFYCAGERQVNQKTVTSKKNPNPIYSIEAIDVENPPSVLSRAEPDKAGIRPPAGFSDKVLEQLAEVKRALTDPQMRRSDAANNGAGLRGEAASAIEGFGEKPSFARAGSSARDVVDVSDFENVINGINAALRRAGSDVHVVLDASFADLPLAVQRANTGRDGKQHTVQGAFHDGRIHVVVDEARLRRARLYVAVA